MYTKWAERKFCEETSFQKGEWKMVKRTLIAIVVVSISALIWATPAEAVVIQQIDEVTTLNCAVMSLDYEIQIDVLTENIGQVDEAAVFRTAITITAIEISDEAAVHRTAMADDEAVFRTMASDEDEKVSKKIMLVALLMTRTGYEEMSVPIAFWCEDGAMVRCGLSEKVYWRPAATQYLALLRHESGTTLSLAIEKVHRVTMGTMAAKIRAALVMAHRI